MYEIRRESQYFFNYKNCYRIFNTIGIKTNFLGLFNGQYNIMGFQEIMRIKKHFAGNIDAV